MADADRDELRRTIIETSLVAHQGHREGSRSLAEGMISLASTGIQAALAINGGAAVAALALIGSLLSRKSLPPEGFGGVLPALALFASGAVMAGIAAALAFVSQSYFTGAYEAHELRFDLEPVKEKPEAAPQHQRARAFRRRAAILVAASYVAFAGGSLSLGWSAANILGYLQATGAAEASSVQDGQ